MRAQLCRVPKKVHGFFTAYNLSNGSLNSEMRKNQTSLNDTSFGQPQALLLGLWGSCTRQKLKMNSKQQTSTNGKVKFIGNKTNTYLAQQQHSLTTDSFQPIKTRVRSKPSPPRGEEDPHMKGRGVRLGVYISDFDIPQGVLVITPSHAVAKVSFRLADEEIKNIYYVIFILYNILYVHF